MIKEDLNLRSFLEDAYNEIQKRNGKSKPAPLEPLKTEVQRLLSRERFFEMRDEQPAVVKAWIMDHKDSVSRAIENPQSPVLLRLMYPVTYLSYVSRLADSWSESMHDEDVRHLLGCGTLEDEVMRLGLRNIARKPRHDTLQEAIIKIVKENRRIKWKQVYKILVERKIVVCTSSGGSIEWVDHHGATRRTPFTALEDRVYRARAKEK